MNLHLTNRTALVTGASQGIGNGTAKIFAAEGCRVAILARSRGLLENLAAGYFGEPEDMGYLITFLASPLARYINGEVIHVDGGMRRFAF